MIRPVEQKSACARHGTDGPRSPVHPTEVMRAVRPREQRVYGSAAVMTRGSVEAMDIVEVDGLRLA